MIYDMNIWFCTFTDKHYPTIILLSSLDMLVIPKTVIGLPMLILAVMISIIKVPTTPMQVFSFMNMATTCS